MALRPYKFPDIRPNNFSLARKPFAAYYSHVKIMGWSPKMGPENKPLEPELGNASVGNPSKTSSTREVFLLSPAGSRFST
jgi:hypothetical protein